LFRETLPLVVLERAEIDSSDQEHGENDDEDEEDKEGNRHVA
jgi:hypothetical protein